MRLGLRLIAVLLGLFTLLITAVMGVARARPNTDPSGWITYSISGLASNASGIYVTSAGGSVSRKIRDNELGVFGFQWTSDGQSLLFVSSLSPQGEIFRLSLDGKQDNLTNSPFDESQITLSPDGKHIAFGLYDGIQAYLAVMPAGGGDVRRLVHTRDYLNEPAWSPDSTWIAFVNHTGDEARIYRVRVDGTESQILLSTRIDGVVSHLAWSADGEWIYFSGRLNGAHTSIFRIRRDGSEIETILSDSNNWRFERLSPGGQWMTATRQVSTASGTELYLMRTDGREARSLTPPSGTSYFSGLESSWSPDGKWIAYTACRVGQCFIVLVSPDGGVQRQLVNPNPFVTPQDLVWSPPIDTPLRWWILLPIGAALVLAGIAPWPRIVWASRPQALNRKDRERPSKQRP